MKVKKAHSKKIFFGWWVLAALCSIYATVNGIVTLSLKRFYPSLIETFGWTQSEVTQPISIFYFIIAFLTPFIGAALDRGNPKRIILAGATLILIGLVGMSQMSSLNHFMAIYIVFSFGVAGAGMASSMYILTRWFRRHRGKAVGILLLGGSLGAAFFNKVTGDAIDMIGWQNTTLLLAALAFLFMIIPWTVVRTDPSEKGLFPDGIERNSEHKSIQDGPSLAQAFRSPELYLIFLTTAALWFCIIGFGQHQDIFFQKELGLSSSKVTNVGSALFLFGVVGKLIFGFLSDSFNKKSIMAWSILLLIIGNLVLYIIAIKTIELSPYWYAFTYGIAYSGVFTMIQIMIAELYSGPSYGKILGVVLTIDTLASVAGIVVLGNMSDHSGSYVTSIQLMIGLCLTALILFLLVRVKSRSSWIGNKKD